MRRVTAEEFSALFNEDEEPAPQPACVPEPRAPELDPKQKREQMRDAEIESARRRKEETKTKQNAQQPAQQPAHFTCKRCGRVRKDFEGTCDATGRAHLDMFMSNDF